MRITVIVTMLACLLLATAASVAAQPTKAAPESAPLPNPVLYFTGVETYKAAGKEFTRYKYGVANSDAYPDSLFAASPNLPPCGQNAKSSRSWVDIFDNHGKRLYGFCAFSKAADLNKIWFSLETGALPPSYVYIEINDRATNKKYKSNLADTVE